MLLTFSKTRMVVHITNRVKVHTIRMDEKKRWRVGMTVHFWHGNPRNTKRDPKPYQFGEGTCSRIQRIQIMPISKCVRLEDELGNMRSIAEADISRLAYQDGFDDTSSFWEWFSKPFYGRLIHFDFQEQLSSIKQGKNEKVIL